MSVDLSVRLGPVVLKNPILTASGLWGYGLDYVDLVDPSRLGAVVTKTLTIEPRLGNPQPRMRELAHGILNSIGLENVGLAAFIQTKLGDLRDRNVDVIVSIAAREESEFAEMIGELSDHEGWLGVELNLSCPNVARGGMDFGRDPERVERIVRSAKAALPGDKCLLVKRRTRPKSAFLQPPARGGVPMQSAASMPRLDWRSISSAAVLYSPAVRPDTADPPSFPSRWRRCGKSATR